MKGGDEIVLRVRGLEKAYNAPVLQEFDFDLHRGEVHALVGSNGAGKSTFARILAGLGRRDRGAIELHGKPHDPAGKAAATRAGVGMVLQELNVIPTLTVAENIFLGRLPSRAGILDRGKLYADAKVALDRVGLGGLDPARPAGALGVGHQQLIEIAGALAGQLSVLILDEPTAALTALEIEKLFENISRLRGQGVSIIYISHRMDEIARIADRVTVLRDGRRIATHDAAAVGVDQLVREMSGRAIAGRGARVGRGGGAVALRVDRLCAGSAVQAVSFEVAEGEILGIAGLVGSGRTETLRAILGADPATGGHVYVGRSDVPLRRRSPADAVAAGIGLVPEDRKAGGLLGPLSVTANTTLSTLSRHARAGILSRRSEADAAGEVTDRLTVKRDSLDQPVGSLSGGNQQKVVIARWLLRDCVVLLFDEPTRGIDVAAKAAIYRCLDSLAEDGKALVVVSADLVELMAISHRILVLSDGRIAGEFHPDSWTQESITAAAFSGYLDKSA